MGLAATLAVGATGPIAGVVALLGAAYAVILVLDDPPLDGRAAIVGAGLLVIGELSFLGIEARVAVTDEGGGVARRVGWVSVTALLALFLGGALLAIIDLVRTGGIAIEVAGAAAAACAIALLVVAGREVRRAPE